MMKRLLLVVVLLCAWSVSAQADRGTAGKSTYTESQKQAAAMLKRAMRQYDLGKFDDAISMLEQAYQEHPWAVILFNLGQAHRQNKTYERARFYYNAYLRNQPDAPNRTLVKNLLAELETMIDKQKALGDRPPPGVSEPGDEIQGTKHITPGKNTGESAGSWQADPIGWTLSGTGAIATGVGIGLFFSASGIESDARLEIDQPTRQRLIDQAKSRKTLGAVVTIGGAAVLVAGVVKLAIAPNREQASTAIALNIGPNWLGISGRF